MSQLLIPTYSPSLDINRSNELSNFGKATFLILGLFSIGLGLPSCLYLSQIHSIVAFSVGTGVGSLLIASVIHYHFLSNYLHKKNVIESPPKQVEDKLEPAPQAVKVENPVSVEPDAKLMPSEINGRDNLRKIGEKGKFKFALSNANLKVIKSYVNEHGEQCLLHMDSNGNSALHILLNREILEEETDKFIEVVNYLRSKGLSPLQTNNELQTPLIIAAQRGHHMLRDSLS